MKINTPCHENFSSMLKIENGRYCNSCSKSVIDFTKYNNEEISEYFLKQSNDEVCGRFKKYQLKEGNLLENSIVKIKNYTEAKIHFSPIRIVILSLLTGILGLASSCMGAVRRPEIRNDNLTTKDSLKQTNKSDTIK